MASIPACSGRSDSNGIYFYQLDTRKFQSGSGNQLGSGGGSTGGTAGDASSNQKTDYGINSDLYADIRKTIEQMVTPKTGRFWLSDATGTLSITDTPDVLERIGRYIEYQNKVPSRQVQLNILSASVKPITSNWGWIGGWSINRCITLEPS